MDIYVKVECKLENGRYCALCCYNTEMLLSPDDIRRIERLGFKREEFVTVKDGIATLKNVNGHCVFLDVKTGKCRIYPHRPLGCRLYPIVYNVSSGEIEVDSLCPKRDTIMIPNVKLLKDILIKHLRACGLKV